VTVTVTNTGTRKGAEVAEVYAALPASADEAWKRLIAYKKVDLAPGESRTVTMDVDPLYLSVWDEAAKQWTRPAGEYRVMAGGSSVDLPLTATVALR
jgi:beta-glucosidase